MLKIISFIAENKKLLSFVFMILLLIGGYLLINYWYNNYQVLKIDNQELKTSNESYVNQLNVLKEENKTNNQLIENLNKKNNQVIIKSGETYKKINSLKENDLKNFQVLNDVLLQDIEKLTRN